MHQSSIDPSSCARYGRDPVSYASHFTDGIQTKCAAGKDCKQAVDAPVANSFHRCISCDLRMHSWVTCGDLWDGFLARIGSAFKVPYLPPHGQDKLAEYAGRDTEQLQICACCMKHLLAKISSPSSVKNICPTSDDDIVDFRSDPRDDYEDDAATAVDDVEVAVITAPPPDDPKMWSKEQWEEFVKTMTWRDFRFSLTDCNRTGPSKTSAMTKLRGIAVSEEYEKPLSAVTVEFWRPVCQKFGIPYRNRTKKQICDDVCKYCEDKEEGERTGVVVSPVDDQGRIVSFNVFRFLNVLFSDKFKARFASRGRALTKGDFDKGSTPDQQLFTDFLGAYNDRSNVEYGRHQHKELAEAKQSPAEFTTIDLSHWLKVREKFKLLFKLYEEFINSCTQSGTHSSREEVEDVSPDQLKKCTNKAVVYMHYFLKDKSNHDLLAIATGTLPKNAFRQSGSNAHRNEDQCCNSESGVVRGGWGRTKGSKSGGGKNGDNSVAVKKDRSTTVAFESIAVRNDVMSHSEVVKIDKYCSDEIEEQMSKKQKLFSELVEDFCDGDELVARAQIKAVMNSRKSNQDDDADSVTAMFPTPTEAKIQAIIRVTDRISKLEGQQKKASAKMEQYTF